MVLESYLRDCKGKHTRISTTKNKSTPANPQTILQNTSASAKFREWEETDKKISFHFSFLMQVVKMSTSNSIYQAKLKPIGMCINSPCFLRFMIIPVKRK